MLLSSVSMVALYTFVTAVVDDLAVVTYIYCIMCISLSHERPSATFLVESAGLPLHIDANTLYVYSVLCVHLLAYIFTS